MKNLLITGGTGFIGRNLSEFLDDKYNLLCPSHKELDLLDQDSVSRYVCDNAIDVVIHAAIHVPMFNGKDNEFFNDMKMFLNLEKISSNVEKIIYFGSGAEYDKRYHIRDVSEDDIGLSIPDTEYGFAKYTMNEIARKSDNIYNLRLFGVFGKYELWQLKFISNLCCKALFDLPLTIRKDCSFNYLYIDDLCAAVNAFISGNPAFHDYNIVHDRSYKLSEIADLVRKISDKDLEIILLSDEKNNDYTASNTRFRAEFADLHITPLYDSISSLFHYYETHMDQIDLNVLSESR